MLIGRVDFSTAAIDLDNANEVVFIDTTSGALAVTLPAPTNPGKIFGVKNVGAAGNNVTVTSRGTDGLSDTIPDGRSNLYMAEGNRTSPKWRHIATSLTSGLLTENLFATSLTTGLGFPRVAHAKYDFAVDGGVVGAITPASNATIPDNAIIIGAVINSTTAVLAAGGAATVSVGTTAGSGAASILGATAKATFALDALIQAIPKQNDSSTFVKMTAAGQINITAATNALSAGVLEIYVFYVVAAN